MYAIYHCKPYRQPEHGNKSSIGTKQCRLTAGDFIVTPSLGAVVGAPRTINIAQADLSDPTYTMTDLVADINTQLGGASGVVASISNGTIVFTTTAGVCDTMTFTNLHQVHQNFVVETGLNNAVRGGAGPYTYTSKFWTTLLT